MLCKQVLKNNLPLYYADALTNEPPTIWDYEGYQIQWNSTDSYEIVRKIGRGKFSEVFEGVDIRNNERIVIKVLKPVKKKKIKREICALNLLQGGPNIIRLIDIVRCPISKNPALVKKVKT